MTGCRLGELLALEAGDVDLKRKVIDLSKTKQNRNHQVVVMPAMAEVLREALDDEERDGAAVFINRKGESSGRSRRGDGQRRVLHVVYATRELV